MRSENRLVPIIVGAVLSLLICGVGWIYILIFRKAELPELAPIGIGFITGVIVILVVIVVIRRIREIKEEENHDFSQY